MTPAKQKGSFAALVVAILIALGLWAPSPVPPQPQPTPTATATAEPTAEPTVAPTALPTPEPPVQSCQLEPSEAANCSWPPPVASVYRHLVEDAQAMVGKEFFDIDGKVRDEHKYVLEVARILREKMALCAIQGTTVADEVWVKKENGFSEHWDIVRADNAPLTMYASRCVPAAF